MSDELNKQVNCTSMSKLKENGVEFTEGNARTLYNELPFTIMVQFVDKSLPPLLVYALQQAVSTLGEILYKCIEAVMYTCLESEAVQNAIDKGFQDAIDRGIEIYFAENKCNYFEASPVWKAKIADYAPPECKPESIGQEECKDCDFYKNLPNPEIPGTNELLKDKLMSFLRNIIMTSIEKAFSTMFFGIMITNWSNKKCTSEKLDKLMEGVINTIAPVDGQGSKPDDENAECLQKLKTKLNEDKKNDKKIGQLSDLNDTLIGQTVDNWEPTLGSKASEKGIRGIRFKIFKEPEKKTA
jgi:hypothetical protein